MNNFNERTLEGIKVQCFSLLMTGLLLSCLFFSCKKFVKVDLPRNEIQSNVVFSNDSTAQASVLGLYSIMMQFSPFMMNAGTTIYAGLSSDELTTNSSSGDYDPYLINAIPVNHSSNNARIWTFAYSNIYQANLIIEGLSNAPQINENLRKQLTGEAKTVRALYYFYLVNFFGDVPLITTTDYRTNAVMPRISIDDVFGQIISDLKDAKVFLNAGYPAGGRIRPNKWTATALLARVYLFQKDWIHAESEATEVINSGIYSLVPILDNVFIMSSNEAIWQLVPSTSTTNTGEGSIFIPFSATTVPPLSLTNFLVNAFEAGDQRKAAWVKSSIIGASSYTYPFKYKIRTGATSEYNIVLRFAEQYLIRAEAQQNKLPEAKSDLNVIRSRAGLGNNTVSDQTGLLLAIEHERQVELFAEWGHRWFDLKRTNRVNTILSAEKPGWNSTDVLYPIPQSELDRNPFLVQNPGY